MKAIVCSQYGSPEVLHLTQVDKPSPNTNQLLIKVHAASITTADTMIRRGHPYIGRLFMGLRKPKYPISGTGFSGVVEAIGKDVTQFKLGDRVFGESVFGHGSHADYTCVAENGVILPLADSMAHDDAASICDGALTSISFLKDIAHIQSGQKVLINGASGSLGSAAVQIAKHLGAHVSAVCSSDNCELVRSLGADTVIDYTLEDFTQSTLRYDIIYDAVGMRRFSQCKSVLSKNGIYLSPVLSFPLLFSMLWSSLLGSRKAKFSATGIRPARELRPLLKELEGMFDLAAIKTVIERKYSPDQIVEAHYHIETGRKKGNAILVMQ